MLQPAPGNSNPCFCSELAELLLRHPASRRCCVLIPAAFSPQAALPASVGTRSPAPGRSGLPVAGAQQSHPRGTNCTQLSGNGSPVWGEWGFALAQTLPPRFLLSCLSLANSGFILRGELNYMDLWFASATPKSLAPCYVPPRHFLRHPLL